MPITIYVNLDTGSIVFVAPSGITPAIEFNFTQDAFTIDSITRLISMKTNLGFGGWVKINLL